METLPQRWLSMSGISTALNLTPTQIKTLYKQKLLVRIGKRPNEYRYLDPTPEYAERLRLAAIMLSKDPDVPIDLPRTFILTVREVAELLGWTVRYAQLYLYKHPIPYFKGKGRVKLYSASEVRKMIWRRQGRKHADKTAPLLLSEIIEYFRRVQSEEESIVPTDAAFVADAQLQKKLRWMMRQPNRDVLLAGFIEKIELAKQVLEKPGRGESDTRQ